MLQAPTVLGSSEKGWTPQGAVVFPAIVVFCRNTSCKSSCDAIVRSGRQTSASFLLLRVQCLDGPAIRNANRGDSQKTPNFRHFYFSHRPSPLKNSTLRSSTLQGVDFGSVFGQFLVSFGQNRLKPTENRLKTDPLQDPDRRLPLRRGEGLWLK